MATVLIADDNQQITSILEEYAKKEGTPPWLLLTASRHWTCLMPKTRILCCWT